MYIFGKGIYWNALIVFNSESVNQTPNDRTVKVDTYLKSPIFLRRMASITTLSAHFEFWSVYPRFSVYETQAPMIAQKKWIHIWKALTFLRRMKWFTNLSACFRFSSVYLGFPVHETPMIAQKKWIHIWKALSFLRRMASTTTVSASNGKYYTSLRSFWIFECHGTPRVWVIKRT